MPREPEHPDIKTARMRWMSLVAHFGREHPDTRRAATDLAGARADVAEVEARRLREIANAMAAGVAA